MEENDKDIYKKFGHRLKNIRVSRDITQIQMANDLGISQTAVVQYEAGSRKVPLSILRKFSNYFSMTLDELVDDEIPIAQISNINKNDDDNLKNIDHIIFSNYPSLLKLCENILNEIDDVDFTDEEIGKITDFTVFIRTQRK